MISRSWQLGPSVVGTLVEASAHHKPPQHKHKPAMRFYGGSSFSKPENALRRAEGAFPFPAALPRPERAAPHITRTA